MPQAYKSQWFAYVDILIDKCVTIDEIERFGLSAVSDACDSTAITEVNNRNKGLFQIEAEKFKNCVNHQKAIIFEGKEGVSFIERDTIAKGKVGSVFHPSISINDHSFRGEYEDPNDLFKTICSVMKNKPTKCSALNFVDHIFQDEPKPDLALKQELDRKKVYQNYLQEQETMKSMDKRAHVAELIFGILIVCVINCACIAYCKMYNKKKTEDRMQI